MFSILLLVSIWSNAHPSTDAQVAQPVAVTAPVQARADKTEPDSAGKTSPVATNACGCANCSGPDKCDCGCGGKCENCPHAKAMAGRQIVKSACGRANCPGPDKCDCGCGGKCENCKRANALASCSCGDNCACGTNCKCAAENSRHHSE